MTGEFDQAYASTQIARSQSWFRRVIKSAYLNSALREIVGPTVDLGCGAGQLLERLPGGSLGLELNSALVATLKAKGSNIAHYDALADNFSLGPVAPNRFQTLIASHVIEHFDDAVGALKKLAASAQRLGIIRIVCIVPGWNGYQSDATHRSFVDPAYIQTNGLQQLGAFALLRTRFFPVDAESFGRIFIYNECVLVWQRADKSGAA